METEKRTNINGDEIKDAFDKNKIAQRYTAMASRAVRFFHIGDKLELNPEEKRYVKLLAGEEILKNQKGKLTETAIELKNKESHLSYKHATLPLKTWPLFRGIDLKVYDHLEDGLINGFNELEVEEKGDWPGFRNYWKWLPKPMSSWAEKNINNKLNKLNRAEDTYEKFMNQKREALIKKEGEKHIRNIESAVHTIISFGIDEADILSTSPDTTYISISEKKIEKWANWWKNILKRDDEPTAENYMPAEKTKIKKPYTLKA